MDWLTAASQCPVLLGVSQDELINLFEGLQFQIRRYQKDEVLASQGEEVKRLMILLEGSARGEMTDPGGHVVKIEDVSAPKPLAGAFLFGVENHYPVDVLANEPVKVLIIYRDEFIKLLRRSEVVMMNYLNLVSSKAQFLSRKIKFLTFKTIKCKIANYIISLDYNSDTGLVIPATQQELADLFGVARPSVARGFSQLEDDGVLSVRNRVVKIRNLEALKQLTVE